MKSGSSRMELLLEAVEGKIAKEMPCADSYDHALAATYAFIAIDEVLSALEESLRSRLAKCQQYVDDHRGGDDPVESLILSEGWEYAADEVLEIITEIGRHKENMMRVWKE